MQLLSQHQTSFLAWVSRNYGFLKSKGFEAPIQAFPSWLYGILLAGEYNEDDKFYINYTIKFIKGIGLTTYHHHWTWDKNGAELDWLVNVKSYGTIRL
jgi:hypothetical protein